MAIYNTHAFIDKSVFALKTIESESKKFLLMHLCLLAKNLPRYDQSLVVKAWKQIQIPEALIIAYLKGKDESALNSNEILLDYLAEYDASFDTVTKVLDIKKDGANHTVTEVIFNAVQNGFKNPSSHIKALLDHNNKNITIVKKFNSLSNYLQSLADNYRGEKLISELASCIPAYDFGDNPEPNFYQNRINRLFTKWLYKCGGQALGLTTNDVMLLWIDPIGGAGKSYLNNWLFSLAEMKQYYMPIRENKSYFPMEIYSSSYIAVDWDELPLSTQRYLMFKSYIAAEGRKVYNSKTKQNDNYERIMSFIGSTNKGNRNHHPGFLLDDDDAMKRRIFAAEINKINYQKYTKDIELSQLWGEVITNSLKIFTENKNAMSWESDWADFRQYNSRYVNEAVNIDRLIHQKILKAAKDDGVIMSAAEILNLFPNAELNTTEIGIKLRVLGFEYSRKAYKRGWRVKLNNL